MLLISTPADRRPAQQLQSPGISSEGREGPWCSGWLSAAGGVLDVPASPCAHTGRAEPSVLFPELFGHLSSASGSSVFLLEFWGLGHVFGEYFSFHPLFFLESARAPSVLSPFPLPALCLKHALGMSSGPGSLLMWLLSQRARPSGPPARLRRLCCEHPSPWEKRRWGLGLFPDVELIFMPIVTSARVLLLLLRCNPSCISRDASDA